MAAVTILAVGTQSRSGTSTPLDVSAYNTFRGDLTLGANFGLDPQGDFWIETGPASSGPWTILRHRKCAGTAWSSQPETSWPQAGADRVTLSGFDKFMRVRWAANRVSETPNSSQDPLADIALRVGLVGEGT